LNKTQWLDEALWQRLNAPTSEGSTLPNAAYIDPEFFQEEREWVFKKNWVFAEFAHKLAETGTVRPVQVAGQSLLLTKDTDGIIRAFHNVCIHRGAALIKESKTNCRNIVCPNHSWSYSLKGKLLARPHFFGGDQHDTQPTDCVSSNLVEVHCDTWHDWIFVNLDGQAGAFSSHIAPIVEKLEGYDLESLHLGGSLSFDIQANWKLAIENFIEPYHVFSCHPWLHSFVTMAERDPPTFEDHILSCGYTFKETDPTRGEGLPYFPNLPDHKKNRGEWYVLFPNFAFEIFPDQLVVFIPTPIDAGVSKETISLYFVGDGAHSEQYHHARNAVIKNWHDLNLEDIGILERMQEGRLSDGFDGGVLSPYWDPVQQHFARLIYQAMVPTSSMGG
jgi:choline monooxygenase